jgi:hypothetical protein
LYLPGHAGNTRTHPEGLLLLKLRPNFRQRKATRLLKFVHVVVLSRAMKDVSEGDGYAFSPFDLQSTRKNAAWM